MPVGGGFVVAGDLYSVAVADFEQRPPRSGYPDSLGDDESAAVAVRQRATLSLS